MKAYNHMMEQISFRKDFCEDTVKKATSLQKPKPVPYRLYTIAACFCLCTVLLLGTALSASPSLRAIVIPNYQTKTKETPTLPSESTDKSEIMLDGIIARYYKLDGVSAADGGFGSAYPVNKKGTLSFYTLSETGELLKTATPRHINTDIIYKGKTWSLDLDVYDGDIPMIRQDGLTYPVEGNHITLGRWEGKLWLPIYVDLTTLEIEDPALNLKFAPDEDAQKTYVYGHPGTSTLLIVAELNSNRSRYYMGNGQTGQITLLGEDTHNRWFLQNGNVYSYNNRVLSLVGEDGKELPLFDGAPCTYDEAGFAFRYNGANLHVIDLRDLGEYLLKNCADTFPAPLFTQNRAGTKLCVSNAESADNLNSTAIAIVDRENGTMVTLKRDPVMKEELMGWFDHNRFLIAGTIEGQWYICLYELPA